MRQLERIELHSLGGLSEQPERIGQSARMSVRTEQHLFARIGREHCDAAAVCFGPILLERLRSQLLDSKKAANLGKGPLSPLEMSGTSKGVASKFSIRGPNERASMMASN